MEREDEGDIITDSSRLPLYFGVSFINDTIRDITLAFL